MSVIRAKRRAMDEPGRHASWCGASNLWFNEAVKQWSLERRKHMRKFGKATCLAAVLLGGVALSSCVVAPPRGDVAFGYSDGYWDHEHHWHAWQNRDDSARFRAANHDHYYDRPHTSDKDQGWHDNDQYWQHR